MLHLRRTGARGRHAPGPDHQPGRRGREEPGHQRRPRREPAAGHDAAGNAPDGTGVFWLSCGGREEGSGRRSCIGSWIGDRCRCDESPCGVSERAGGREGKEGVEVVRMGSRSMQFILSVHINSHGVGRIYNKSP